MQIKLFFSEFLSLLTNMFVFRNDNREEYVCVQMIHIHLLSKYPSEFLSICMKQFPLEYLTLTKSEAKLFQYINQFHSNGSLDKRNQLDYSRKDTAFITPLTPFLQFYQFISMKFHQNSVSYDERETPSNNYEISRSYCRPIKFHDKQIMSYCTSSINESNETLICLSINDIVQTYFPWTNVDNFLHLCRLKQIVRYKPDKSTNSDLSLRLINIEQLEKYWFYFIQQLLPEEKKSLFEIFSFPKKTMNSFLILVKYQTKKSKLLTEKIIEDKVLSNENNVEIECLLNELIIKIEQNLNSDKFENKQTIEEEEKEEENKAIPVINKKNSFKRKRRRHSDKFSYRLKRRKRKQSIDKIQFWLNKYSIKPVSVCLQRISLPSD